MALMVFDGNRTLSAKHLGISLRSIRAWIRHEPCLRKWKIEPNRFKRLKKIYPTFEIAFRALRNSQLWLCANEKERGMLAKHLQNNYDYKNGGVL